MSNIPSDIIFHKNSPEAIEFGSLLKAISTIETLATALNVGKGNITHIYGGRQHITKEKLYKINIAIDNTRDKLSKFNEILIKYIAI